MKLHDDRAARRRARALVERPDRVMMTLFPSVIIQQQVNSRLDAAHPARAGRARSTSCGRTSASPTTAEEMTRRRLRQANLFGPAGFVSADDGEVIELSQHGFAAERPRARSPSSTGPASATPPHMVTETLIRGMYAYWRKVMEACERAHEPHCSRTSLRAGRTSTPLRQRRRQRATATRGRSSSPTSASTRVQPRENHDRGFPLATCSLREQGHAEGPRVRHHARRSSTTRTTSAT